MLLTPEWVPVDPRSHSEMSRRDQNQWSLWPPWWRNLRKSEGKSQDLSEENQKRSQKIQKNHTKMSPVLLICHTLQGEVLVVVSFMREWQGRSLLTKTPSKGANTTHHHLLQQLLYQHQQLVYPPQLLPPPPQFLTNILQRTVMTMLMIPTQYHSTVMTPLSVRMSRMT